MGAINTKQYEDINTMVLSLIFAPAQRFFTTANMLTYIQRASVEYAQAIGGLHLIDTTVKTVASQSRYALNPAHRRIRRAYYMQNFGLETEVQAPLEIFNEETMSFDLLISSTQLPNTGFAFNLTGNPVAIPKFVLDRTDQNLMVIRDPPANANDTIKLYTLSMPSALGPGITWDGDEQDVNAIAYLVCWMARMKSRDGQEAGVFKQQYLEVVQDYRKLRSRQNQVRMAQDAKFLNSYTRSINGSMGG